MKLILFQVVSFTGADEPYRINIMVPEVSIPMPAPTPLFIVNKPEAYSSLALENSKSAGDLISALRESQAITDDDLKYALHNMVYEVKGDDDTASVPLNGPKYDKNTPLPPSAAGLYHISAKFINEEYAILVRFPMPDLVIDCP